MSFRKLGQYWFHDVAHRTPTNNFWGKKIKRTEMIVWCKWMSIVLSGLIQDSKFLQEENRDINCLEK